MRISIQLKNLINPMGITPTWHYNMEECHTCGLCSPQVDSIHYCPFCE